MFHQNPKERIFKIIFDISLENNEIKFTRERGFQAREDKAISEERYANDFKYDLRVTSEKELLFFLGSYLTISYPLESNAEKNLCIIKRYTNPITMINAVAKTPEIALAILKEAVTEAIKRHQTQQAEVRPDKCCFIQ